MSKEPAIMESVPLKENPNEVRLNFYIFKLFEFCGFKTIKLCNTIW